MEVAEIYYKAKDGRIFTDPLECEEYEKKLGIIPGTIGELVRTLEDMPTERIVCMMVLYWDNKRGIQLRQYLSVPFADEDDPLAFEKDRVSKISAVIKDLKEFPQDAKAQWIGYTTESFKAESCTLSANCNRGLFDLANEKKK